MNLMPNNLSRTTVKSERVHDLLAPLLTICRDGEEGFRLAAQRASDPALKAEFERMAGQRATFVSELQNLQGIYGVPPEPASGSLTGALHRAWITLRESVSSSDDQALLDEAERGEDAAVKAYRDALESETDIPMEVREQVEAQAFAVKQTHDTVRALRDAGRGENRGAA